MCQTVENGSERSEGNFDLQQCQYGNTNSASADYSMTQWSELYTEVWPNKTRPPELYLQLLGCCTVDLQQYHRLQFCHILTGELK